MSGWKIVSRSPAFLHGGDSDLVVVVQERAADLHGGFTALRGSTARGWTFDASRYEYGEFEVAFDRPSKVTALAVRNKGSGFVSVRAAKGAPVASAPFLVHRAMLLTPADAAGRENLERTVNVSQRFNALASSEYWSVLQFRLDPPAARCGECGLIGIFVERETKGNDAASTDESSSVLSLVSSEENQSTPKRTKMADAHGDVHEIVPTLTTMNSTATEDRKEHSGQAVPQVHGHVHLLNRSSTFLEPRAAAATAPKRSLSTLAESPFAEPPVKRPQADWSGTECAPLRGVVFALSGVVNPERRQLRETGEGLGAVYLPEWSASATHLVSAFDGTPKLVQARRTCGGRAYLVKPSWLRACAQTKRHVSEASFAWSGSCTAPFVQPADDDEVYDESTEPATKQELELFQARLSTHG